MSFITAGPCRQQAIQVVLDRCQEIWQAGFPEINEVSGFAGYLRDIAAAFHPDQEKPELCVTAGSLIRASHSAVDRLQDILRRPGFSRFQKIRIRHIRKAWNWYDRISRYRAVQAYIRYRRWINRTNVLRLILLPDPFSWLIYLSNQLTILSLTRFFLMDIYLFAGKQAILAYDHETRHEAIPQDAGEIEQDLSDLAELIEPEFRAPGSPNSGDSKSPGRRQYPDFLISRVHGMEIRFSRCASGDRRNIFSGKSCTG